MGYWITAAELEQQFWKYEMQWEQKDVFVCVCVCGAQLINHVGLLWPHGL